MVCLKDCGAKPVHLRAAANRALRGAFRAPGMIVIGMETGTLVVVVIYKINVAVIFGI